MPKTSEMTSSGVRENGARPTLIIAEAGVNHNGSPELAMQLVDVAAAAGADIVKFQTFRAGRVVSLHAQKAAYQKVTTGVEESQREMIQKLELDIATHRQLRDHCHHRGIEFLSTPFDAESVDDLVELGLERLKIPSGEITNGPLILKIARTGLPCIVSTGMANLGEVESILGVLAFGYLDELGDLGSDELPSLEAFARARRSPEGQEVLARNVSLLHCTTEYPAPFAESNLRVLDTLRTAFHLPVGLSDHTTGITVAFAAVACGATIIEKHFTLDRNLPGPDHKASLEPGELSELVQGIRCVEVALGTGVKSVVSSEEKNRPIARKSLVADCPIKKGELFSSENLTAKRPGTGISPMNFWSLLGKPANRDYAEDELIGL